MGLLNDDENEDKAEAEAEAEAEAKGKLTSTTTTLGENASKAGNDSTTLTGTLSSQTVILSGETTMDKALYCSVLLNSMGGPRASTAFKTITEAMTKKIKSNLKTGDEPCSTHCHLHGADVGSDDDEVK